jgi:hypothetical protein
VDIYQDNFAIVIYIIQLLLGSLQSLPEELFHHWGAELSQRINENHEMSKVSYKILPLTTQTIIDEENILLPEELGEIITILQQQFHEIPENRSSILAIRGVFARVYEAYCYRTAYPTPMLQG